MSTTSDITRIVADLRGVNVVILTATGADGQPRSRPMALQEVDDDGTLWFFIGRSSHVAQELQSNSRVAIAAVDHVTMKYLALTGMAREVTDRSRTSTLWRDDYLQWFPLGVADPELALYRVDPTAVEGWLNGTHLHVALGETRPSGRSVNSG